MITSRPDDIHILRATERELASISRLAAVIWPVCYAGIISTAQMDYMLGRMYSPDTLRDEVRNRGVRFELLTVAGEPTGFASHSLTSDPTVAKLHKLYVLPQTHGSGLGWRLLLHCEAACHARGARRLILTVNKQNARAIAFYQRNGFTSVEAVVTDIGGGFVMDDYIMAKELAGPTGRSNS